MSETRKLFESFQHNLNEAQFKKVDETLILTDEMLNEIPFPSGKIVFNNEIQIPSLNNVYKDGRIRVVIADNNNYWAVSEYDIGLDYGYGGYYLDYVSKSDCPTIESLIEELFINGSFVDQGYSVAGLNYPEEMNESEESELDKWWDENYDLGDIEDKRKILNNINENETVENKKLTKDTRDDIEIGDILADNSNRYVVVNIINNPKSKAITVRDEKDWRPIYADPISNWYGTTIIKGPFIRKNGKVIKEKEMNESENYICYEEPFNGKSMSKAFQFKSRYSALYSSIVKHDGNIIKNSDIVRMPESIFEQKWYANRFACEEDIKKFSLTV